MGHTRICVVVLNDNFDNDTGIFNSREMLKRKEWTKKYFNKLIKNKTITCITKLPDNKLNVLTEHGNHIGWLQ